MSRKYASRIASIPAAPTHQHYAVPQNIDADMPRNMRRSASPGFRDGNELGLEFVERPPSSRYHAHTDYNSGAEDAARELEESVLGGPSSPVRQGYHDSDARKRNAAAALSDASSDFDVPISKRDGNGLPVKRRKTDHEFNDITDELERSIDDGGQSISAISVRKGKGKGKGIHMHPSVPGADMVVGKIRKKPGPKKKGDQLLSLRAELGPPSASVSIAGDMTPIPSVPPSPALSTAMIYEIGEVAPPLRRAKRVDENTMLKRVTALEEAQRKVWLNIARRDVAKVI